MVAYSFRGQARIVQWLIVVVAAARMLPDWACSRFSCSIYLGPFPFSVFRIANCKFRFAYSALALAFVSVPLDVNFAERGQSYLAAASQSAELVASLSYLRPSAGLSWLLAIRGFELRFELSLGRHSGDELCISAR